MKIVNETELMKNQKHAVLMAPGKQFEVLQSQEGNALFFSIGTDGIFYLTRETPQGTHGWNRIDLGGTLTDPANKIIAKSFDVAQDLTGATTDIAFVVSNNGVDTLYMSTGNANTDNDWLNVATNGLTFTAIPFQSDSNSADNLNIADINFCKTGQGPFLQVDIIQNGSNTGNYINRYFVDPNLVQTGNYWNAVSLAFAMSAGDIQVAQGYLYSEAAPGTYTLSGLNTLSGTEMQLAYRPFYNAFDSTLDPTDIRFTIPASTRAIGISQAFGSGDGGQDDTNLFVSADNADGTGSLYFIPAAQQQDLHDITGNRIVTHANLAGVQSLHVNYTASLTAVWGLNENGDVFYMSCAFGSEATGSAWSVPAIIASGVENIAPYINGQQNNLVIFAHLGNDSMEQLIQDAATSHWSARDIHLPTADPMDMVENYTFTTHIQLTDDNNMPYQNQAVDITANVTCSLYINEVYHVLYPGVPLNFTCDATGVITLIQTVDTLAGVCFNISDGTQTVNVNPMTNILNSIKNQCADDGSGPNLNINVNDEMGNSSSLIPSGTKPDDVAQIQQYIAQFIIANADVPADGSQHPDSVSAVYDPKATPDHVFGMYQKDGRLYYYEGAEASANVKAMFRANRKVSAGLLGDDEDDSIEVLAGDAWRWLKHKVEDVVKWEVQKFGAINHFIFTIANAEYHLVLGAMHDIANGIHFVLHKIAVAFEDLIKWLGSIFAWKDILTTHAVLKEYFLKYMRHSISNIDNLRASVDKMAATVNSEISNLTGLPSDSCSSGSASNTNDGGQNKPSSNWAQHHTKANATNGQCDHQAADPTSLMEVLMNAVEAEGDTISTAIQQLDGVFKEIGTMSAADIIKQIIGVLAEAFVSSSQNLIDALLEVAAVVLGDVEKTLDAPIYIPVISPVYKLFAHADLSIMDVACLVAAIPVTVIYKIANGGSAPFSSDDISSFSNAADFTAIAQMCFETSTVSVAENQSVGRWTPPQLKTGKLYDKLEFSGNICAAFGSLALSVIGTIKTAAPAMNDNKILAGIGGACYFPYIAPDILGQVVVVIQDENTWYDVMNTVLAGACTIKALVDMGVVLGKKAPANAVQLKSSGTQSNYYAIQKAKLVSAPKLVLVGDDEEDDGDDINPPAPDPNVQPPANPDPPAPDPDAPVAGGDAANGIEAENPWANIPINEGPQPTQKFDVPATKKSWDFASPILDAALNAVWNIPVGFVFANSEKKTNDILGMVGNLMFNVGGMIAPIAAWGVGPVKWGGVIVQDVCNLGYGAMSAATSLDNQPVDS